MCIICMTLKTMLFFTTGIDHGNTVDLRALQMEERRMKKSYHSEVIPVRVWANAILTVGSPECLTVRLTVRSQCDHSELTATTAWWSGDLTNGSQQAHGVSCKLMEGSQEAHCASSSCEFAVSYMSGLNMSLSWVFMWAQSESTVSSNSSLGRQC